ncbi:hypothetical protein [Micromonospora zhanjiangensis]
MPEQHEVGQPDPEQHQQPAQQQHPWSRDTTLDGVEQQAEPDTEEEGEDGKEALRNQQAHPVDAGVGSGRRRRGDDDPSGVGYRLDVGQQDAAEREAADHVERDDTSSMR